MFKESSIYNQMKVEVPIFLIGAGPGDSNLLTVRAKGLLQHANLVLYDNLVSQEVLSLTPINAKLIYVGKSAFKLSLTQEEINQILIDESNKLLRNLNQNNIIIRLKGGDPFVFGRAYEEMSALKKNNFKFEIIPGISSFHASMIQANIPFTERKLSSSFTINTGHHKKGNHKKILSKKYGDTMIYMMAIKNVENIVNTHLEKDKPPDTPVAIIERATHQKQRILITTLSNLIHTVSIKKVISPSIIIIGDVVNIYSEFKNYIDKKFTHKHLVYVGNYLDKSIEKKLFIHDISFSQAFFTCSFQLNKHDINNFSKQKNYSIKNILMIKTLKNSFTNDFFSSNKILQFIKKELQNYSTITLKNESKVKIYLDTKNFLEEINLYNHQETLILALNDQQMIDILNSNLNYFSTIKNSKNKWNIIRIIKIPHIEFNQYMESRNQILYVDSPFYFNSILDELMSSNSYKKFQFIVIPNTKKLFFIQLLKKHKIKNNKELYLRVIKKITTITDFLK